MVSAHLAKVDQILRQVRLLAHHFHGWSWRLVRTKSIFSSRPAFTFLVPAQPSHLTTLRCPSCTAAFYPTTAPVGIVSIGDPSTDTLLLIRQPRYPPGILNPRYVYKEVDHHVVFCTGMYSCIAGFMDPGEPLEECVRREVAEEVKACPTEYSWM